MGKKYLQCSKSYKAFTLVEILLYIAIVTLILGALGVFFAVVIGQNAKSKAVDEVFTEGSRIIEIISQTIRNGTNVTIPAANSTGSSLTITVTDAAKNPTVIILNNGVIQITEGAGSAINISSNRVTVSALTFSNYTRNTANDSVRIQFTVTNNNINNRKESQFTQTFYATASVR